MRIRNGITSVFLLVATLFTGNAFAADTYTVAAEITHADGPVGSPTVVVNAGTPASVSVGGENGYTLAVDIKPVEAGTVKVGARLETSRGHVSSLRNGDISSPMVFATGEIGLRLTVTEHGE